MWGTHRQVINSLATSVTSLTPHLSAIVACFDFWREISHPAFSDFCNTICQQPTWLWFENDGGTSLLTRSRMTGRVGIDVAP
jgi:hypothetical protein